MGHADLNELRNLIKKRRIADKWPGMVNCQFHDKTMQALGTADILAYEFVKRIKDYDKRPVRKSLRALIPERFEGDNHKTAFLLEPVLQQIARLLSVTPPRKPA